MIGLVKSRLPQSKITENVFMLTGAGGNIGLLRSEEGLLMIDDQFAPLAEKIEAAMSKLAPGIPLKYVVNTHYHGDHSGSNAHFVKMAPVFAHENVRVQLKKQGKVEELPVVTYETGVTIHLGGEEIQLMHLPKGHTDGDTIVYFEKANVLHMGDLFFHNRFPYIDLKHGGSVKGYLKNITKVYQQFPDDVTIIPGHGELTTKTDLKKVIDMLEYSISMIERKAKDKVSIEDMHAQGMDGKYQEWAWNFINQKRWLTTLTDDLVKEKQ